MTRIYFIVDIVEERIGIDFSLPFVLHIYIFVSLY